MIPLYTPYYAKTNLLALSEGFAPGQQRLTEKNIRAFFEERYGFSHVFFTKSCTSALETLALLLDLQAGDEVIVPSYTYVSTANAFALHGARIVFADSEAWHPNVDVKDILQRITPSTKAVIVMHYAGIAVRDLELLRITCDEKKIFLIEDAAHCIGAFEGPQALGSFGHAAVFSFHESKNIGCTDGGMLVLQHTPWNTRADILLNKGTNRAMFERREAARYEWVDTGSAYRMDALHMSLLFDQLQYLDQINRHRLMLYDFYLEALKPLRQKGLLDFYTPGAGQKHNAHIFWIRLGNLAERDALQKHLHARGVHSTFHYLALHKSPYGKRFAGKEPLVHAGKFEEELLRIPLYYPMPLSDAELTAAAITQFFEEQ